MAQSGSLKVEGAVMRDSSKQYSTLTVPSTTSPPCPPIFKSVVAHRRPGGQSVSIKLVQANLLFGISGKPSFNKLGQVFVEIGEGTANVTYILSVAKVVWRGRPLCNHEVVWSH